MKSNEETLRGFLNEQNVVKALTAKPFIIKCMAVGSICNKDISSLACSADVLLLLDLSCVPL